MVTDPTYAETILKGYKPQSPIDTEAAVKALRNVSLPIIVGIDGSNRKVNKDKPIDTPVPDAIRGLLNGPDNTMSYSYIGYIRRDVFNHGGAKARVQYNAPSVRAFAWAWQQLVSSNEIPSKLEIWHEGKCGRCARTLTVPESIESGFGPECMGRLRVVPTLECLGL